jgi:hypothetical protein
MLVLLDLTNEELIGDEELIAEVQRRGYRVHCPEVPCPECGTMCSVPPRLRSPRLRSGQAGQAPREAGRVVTCDFCGERIDSAPLSPTERRADALIASAA